MISIIISSYKEHFFKQVTASIEETIGVPFQVIKIDNPGILSIGKAYNQGATKAAYNLLCFVHEDVLFKTKNWGQNLVSYFNAHKELGLVGVAGSTQKPFMPFTWPHYIETENKLNLIQHFKENRIIRYNTFSGAETDFVTVLDGVFLATRKEIWQAIRFDEKMNGFHLYDIDFSTRVAQTYKVAVVYNILIEHFSSGVYGNDWVTATLQYYQNKEKADLFTTTSVAIGKVRRYCYQYLSYNCISFRNRVVYTFHLGIDKTSLSAAFVFLFPAMGKVLYHLTTKARRLFAIKD